MEEIEILRRRLAREQQARHEAERIIESKSLELYEKNRQLAAISRQLAKYVPAQVTLSLLTGRATADISASREFLTVLFSDLHGFTHATEVLEPEEMATLLNEYLSAMAQLTTAFGGTFDKSMGDGLMVFFGAPESRGHSQDAAAAIQLALAMQKRIAELNERWVRHSLTQGFRARIGIDSGLCTVGNFGSENRLEYTAIGGPVNLASRLEHIIPPGQVAVSENTRALVADQFRFQELGRINLKGMARAVQIFRALDEPAETVPDAAPPAQQPQPHPTLADSSAA